MGERLMGESRCWYPTNFRLVFDLPLVLRQRATAMSMT